MRARCVKCDVRTDALAGGRGRLSRSIEGERLATFRERFVSNLSLRAVGLLRSTDGEKLVRGRPWGTGWCGKVVRGGGGWAVKQQREKQIRQYRGSSPIRNHQP